MRGRRLLNIALFATPTMPAAYSLMSRATPPAGRRVDAVPDADARLLDFSRQVIEQAATLARWHTAPGAPAYAGPVGAHLRHVIEHYEALLGLANAQPIDYDQRPRDAALDASPFLALQRLQAIRDWLNQEAVAARLDQPVELMGVAGLSGEWSFQVRSTLGRELMFLASHAVHHFALLQAHCAAVGLPVGPGFGKAPATVAHEQACAQAARAAS